MFEMELLIGFGIIGIFLLCVAAVIYAGAWARKRGRRPWVWRMIVGGALYLALAWDQIPTFLIGEYYCSTQAGLVVNETPRQWLYRNIQSGNSAVMNFYERSSAEDVKIEDLNPRMFAKIEVKKVRMIPVWVTSMSVIDKKDYKVLMAHKLVAAGYYRRPEYNDWKNLKLWVLGPVCWAGFSESISLKEEYRKVGKEILNEK